MVDLINLTDLPESMQSEDFIAAMVSGANAQAARVAPCLAATTDSGPSPAQVDEAKLVLLGAVSRWVQAGSGALVSRSETKGPFSESEQYASGTVAASTGYRLWPTEIAQLQDICKNGDDSTGVFSVNTAPGIGTHLPWCSINFGASYCDCGMDIAGQPIYGG